MRTSLGTLPSPDTISRQTTSVISLGQIRPGPRVTNEYVDSPRAHLLLPLKTPQSTTVGGGSSLPGYAHRIQLPLRAGDGSIGSLRSPVTSSATVQGHSVSKSSVVSQQPVFKSSVVSQQPISKSPPVTKDPLNSLDKNGDCDISKCANGHTDESVGINHSNSILCERCGKCKCSDCTEPRNLPSHWCCRNTCEISPAKALDVCTCFCCIKCVFYHCGAEEDNECYDRPCGCCLTPHCCKRWTVMGLVSLCLPCLWMYWPARACLAGCTACYNRIHRHGCQCHSEHGAKPTDSAATERNGSDANKDKGSSHPVGNSRYSQSRRLLIESDSSSA